MQNLKCRVSFVVIACCLILMPPAFGQASWPEPTQENIARFARDLKSPVKNTRFNAFIALTEMGSAASSAAPALANLLKDKDITASIMACNLLGNMGASAAPAAPALIKVLNDKQSHIGGNVAAALRDIMQNVKKQIPQMRGPELAKARHFWRDVKARLYQTKDRDIPHPADFEKAELAAFHLVEALEAAK